MAKRKQLNGADRKASLLDAGAKLAAKHGASNVTRRMVAEAVKCSEALVSVYMGDTPTAQKAYARHAKKIGLSLPDKAKTEAIGKKLRAHGPRDKRDTRKRSVKEVKAIKRKRETKPAAPVRTKPVTKRETKPKTAPVAKNPVPSETKSAARAPKAPPALAQRPASS